MNRRLFLKAAGVSAGAFLTAGCQGLTAAAGGGASRPNVVLVMTDDQGYGDVGALGNQWIKTPNLDALHAESVRLTDYHVDPTCAPTRAALMTGRYSSRTGVWHTIMGRSIMRADEVTMADVFSGSGYRTGIFGKWHLGDNYPYRPEDRGFDETLVHGGGGVGQTPDHWGNDYFDDTYVHNGVPKKYAGYCTDVWFDGAMRFIETNRKRPFFCYIPTNAPHSPYNVGEAYSDLYKGRAETPNANFWGMVTNIDDNVGRLVKHLERLGLAENTILIFTTDNGTAAGVRFARDGAEATGFNAGMRGAKGSHYDGGHRVPCFVRWPGGGIDGGRDVEPLCAHIDMLPTLIELCRLKRPAVEFDGSSLAEWLTGRRREWPERTLFVHSQRIEHPEKWRQSAVMTQRWRLINGKELYDVKADPGQRRDLSGQNPEVVGSLREAYERWWRSISLRFDEYVPIYIGSEAENPVRMTCHDWHGPDVPWDQSAVRNAGSGNGFWAVRVVHDGVYRFELRRWPQETDLAIGAAGPGKAIDPKSARLKIANFDATKPIRTSERAAVFETPLQAGEATLQTWFMDEDGASRGAYYVYVTRLG
ncbi:MAG: arylsulfatase [Phycisphaerae bacterium]|nr:arylsulfatase [Phycisphaerae bacterium]